MTALSTASCELFMQSKTYKHKEEYYVLDPDGRPYECSCISKNKDDSALAFCTTLYGYTGTFLATCRTDLSDFDQTYERAESAFWDSTGKRLVCSNGGTIYTILPDGSGKNVLPIQVDGTPTCAKPSPTSNLIAFIMIGPFWNEWTADRLCRLYLFNPDDGNLLMLSENWYNMTNVEWYPSGDKVLLLDNDGYSSIDISTLQKTPIPYLGIGVKNASHSWPLWNLAVPVRSDAFLYCGNGSIWTARQDGVRDLVWQLEMITDKYAETLKITNPVKVSPSGGESYYLCIDSEPETFLTDTYYHYYLFMIPGREAIGGY